MAAAKRLNNRFAAALSPGVLGSLTEPHSEDGSNKITLLQICNFILAVDTAQRSYPFRSF